MSATGKEYMDLVKIGFLAMIFISILVESKGHPVYLHHIDRNKHLRVFDERCPTCRYMTIKIIQNIA